MRRARLIGSTSSLKTTFGDSNEQDQRTRAAAFGVLDMNDEAVGHTVDRFDHFWMLVPMRTPRFSVRRRTGDDTTALPSA